MSDKINMSVDIAGVTLENPITVASGTFGSGMEYSEFVDLSQLGAVTTKGVANVPWPGNATPRVAEVRSGTSPFFIMLCSYQHYCYKHSCCYSTNPAHFHSRCNIHCHIFIYSFEPFN